MPGKCSFSDLWIRNPKYQTWLNRVASDKHKARCNVCQKTFDISNMGESALMSHMNGQKHKAFLQSVSLSTCVKDYFVQSQQASTSSSSGYETKNTQSLPSTSSLESKTKLSTYLQKNETLSAEILWTLKVVSAHYSYKSCQDIQKLFQLMFTDSAIASHFSCGETKCAYLAYFGLAPHFQSMLLNSIKEQEYALMFDESLNKITQSKQMDFLIRLWVNNEVHSRYFTSEFLGHGTAEIMFEKFCEATGNLDLKLLLQLSMDGPNVNWKFHDLVENKMQKDYNCSVLNIGSCGLHIIHGAFKSGADETDWNINKLLSSLYWLFKDTPARKDDYIKVTGGNLLPLKFCQHCWLENVPVAERVILIWPHILQYVQSVGKKTLKDPKTKSFEIVKENCKDKLLLVKLKFFLSVSKQIVPFLTLYQTDKAMIPFLCSDFEKMIRALMNRFIKNDILLSASSPYKLSQVDLSDELIFKNYKDIDIGFSTEECLKEVVSKSKLSSLEVMTFKMQCKSFLSKTVKKLLLKSPMNYSLVRNVSCIDPREMHKKESCILKMKNILKILVSAKRVNESDCDSILWQLGEFIDKIVISNEDNFKSFDPSSHNTRVDVFFHGFLSSNPAFNKLWMIIKRLLLLSHGQASIERGFSINKEIVVENLQEKSLIAQRIIYDHINSINGIYNVEMSKGLLLSASAAHKRYLEYLEQQKILKKKTEGENKRKTLLDDIEEMKTKKARIEKDIESLLKSADDFAEKAEATGAMSWITKSNSFRRTAKDKKITLLDVETNIEKKKEELKQA